MTTLTYAEIYALRGGLTGTGDYACPLCGPDCKSKANQVREVLRVTLKPDGFAVYICQRCGAQGHAFEDSTERPKPVLRSPQTDDDPKPRLQGEKANWMWSNGRSPRGSAVETYLAGRGITCQFPSTLRYLQPRKPEHHPAMIAAFGLPSEPEPGVLHIRSEHVRGIHLTLLAPDGRGKAGTDRDKLMVGPSMGWPIVLAPPNDGLALVIAEGIETALSVHQETGLGAWAAGAAGRMPALADKIPDYIACVTIALEQDPAGARGADELAARLNARGIEVTVMEVANGL